METMLNRIKNYKMTLELTLDEAEELKELLEKKNMRNGIPTDDGNKCPNCFNVFHKGTHHCPVCGQRVKYIESNDIPL